MKKLKALLLMLVVLVFFTTACTPMGQENYHDSSAPNSSIQQPDSSTPDSSTPDSSVPDSSMPDSSTADSSIPDSSNPEEDPFAGYETISVADAIVIAGADGNVTERLYYLIVTVESVTNPMFGAMIVSDETGSISVYNSASADGSVPYEKMEEKPYKGDVVLMYCVLQNFKGTPEIKSGWIIDFYTPEVDIEEGEYQEMTIAEARLAEKDAKVKVTGVVAGITYAMGMKPNGVYLVDETSSIYVFDGDLAGRVAKGNEITILANKAYWILEGEISAAQAHGYKGCNQLDGATLISNDEQTHAYDKSWIQEVTVKEIMETPMEKDVTTTIYKVNSLVHKADMGSFVNYYFNDLDGVTGSYTYTQCSGADFTWIDQFDGKICTVYLAVHNAKSTSSGCSYRFIPIEIIDENYSFDTANAAKFAVEYYGVGQFESLYNASPETELTTIVSSELLGFEGATITYTSSNTEVAYFENLSDKAIFHLKDYGTATITVTGSYGGVEYSENVEITYEEPVTYDSITVSEAIATAYDTDVIVEGIVGPSSINQTGFYLFGDDGSVIAVKLKDKLEFADLSIGNRVVLSGMRERYVKDDTASIAGQTCIVNADILVNYYGNYEYSTAKFTDITGSQFAALDCKVDYSTNVYVLTGKVNLIEQYYFSTINLVAEDGVEVELYMSSADQYEFLKPYANQTITVEIAPCNWNDKGFWKGCVIAIRLEDGSKILNEYYFDLY